MTEPLRRSAWILGLRGILAILFGLLALLLPLATLLGLVALFAAFAMVTGVVCVYGAVKNRPGDKQWWLLLLLGLVAIGSAIITIIYPGLTALALIAVIATFAFVIGAIDIATGIRLRKQIDNEWMLILSGMAGVIFGALALVFPIAGALAVVWVISLYATLTGVLLLAAAFNIRKRMKHRTQEAKQVSDKQEKAA